MAKITRRQALITLGGGGVAYGAARGGKYIYDGTRPTTFEDARFKGIWTRYPFTQLPLRLTSSYAGKIRHVFVGSFPECSAETEALCKTLEKHVAPVTRISDRDVYLRDALLVTQDGTLLVSPMAGARQRRTLRDADSAIAELAQHNQIRCAPFRFQGGIMLQADGRTWMAQRYFEDRWTFMIDDSPVAYDEELLRVGMRKPIFDYSLENSWLPEILGGEGRAGEIPEPDRLYRQMGLDPALLPSDSVLGHIDLLTTPTAPDRMLLADNAWGLEIIRSLGMGELSEYLERTHEHIARNDDLETANRFRSIFLQLRESGRMPTPRSYIKDSFASVTADCDAIEKRPPVGTVVRVPSLIGVMGDYSICFSYNNALLESTPQRKLAVVPNFGIKALDNEALGVFKGQGYQTVPVTCTVTSLYGAAVHCVTVEKRG